MLLRSQISCNMSNPPGARRARIFCKAWFRLGVPWRTYIEQRLSISAGFLDGVYRTLPAITRS